MCIILDISGTDVYSISQGGKMVLKKIITGALDENCYILSDNGTCIIIDPGSEMSKIKQEVETDKILAVLITHMHFDHIGALNDILEKDSDITVYKKCNLEDNQILNIGDFKIKVIFTPGHSSDSVSYYLEKEKIMFTGDFIFKDTVGRCDLSTGDMSQMNESLKKITSYPNDIKLLSGHGDETTLGQEKQTNYYLHELE